MPNPPDAVADANAAPPKITRLQAQVKFGLFAKHDYVMLTLICFTWITLGYWKLFGDIGALHVIAGMLLTIIFMMLWLITLVYRVLVWILDVQADINLMPESAARIVLGYMEGRVKK